MEPVGREHPDQLELILSRSVLFLPQPEYSSSNQGMEVEMASLLLNLTDLDFFFLLLSPITFGSAGLEVLVPKEGMLPPDNTAMASLN